MSAIDLGLLSRIDAFPERECILQLGMIFGRAGLRGGGPWGGGGGGGWGRGGGDKNTRMRNENNEVLIAATTASNSWLKPQCGEQQSLRQSFHARVCNSLACKLATSAWSYTAPHVTQLQSQLVNAV